MGRMVALFAGLFMLLSWPGNVAAQDSGGTTEFPGGSFLASVPGLGSFDVAGLRLTPNVRVGHQWIGLNFNLPASSALPFVSSGESAAIDIQLTDAHVWTGSVGLESRLSPRLSLSLNAEANAKRSVGAVTAEEPLQQVIGLAPFRWTASQLEWWALEGSLTYAISNDLAVFAGLRREHVAFGLDDPRDRFGNPVNSVIGIPGVVLLTDTNAADFRLKLWVPYIGLRLSGASYRAKLSWSPVVAASVKIPDHFLSNILVLIVPATVSTGFEWQYSMFRTGTQLDADFEYELRLNSSVAVKGWVKGSWLKVRGSGNADQLLNNFASVPPITIFAQLAGQDTATATLTRYVTAAGLAAELAF